MPISLSFISNSIPSLRFVGLNFGFFPTQLLLYINPVEMQNLFVLFLVANGLPILPSGTNQSNKNFTVGLFIKLNLV